MPEPPEEESGSRHKAQPFLKGLWIRKKSEKAGDEPESDPKMNAAPESQGLPSAPLRPPAPFGCSPFLAQV